MKILKKALLFSFFQCTYTIQHFDRNYYQDQLIWILALEQFVAQKQDCLQTMFHLILHSDEYQKRKKSANDLPNRML